MQQVQQVQRVQQGNAVAVVERSATGAYIRSPVASRHRNAEVQHQRPSRQTPEPWPPAELSLPNLDQLERISRGEEPLPPSDTKTAARCQFAAVAHSYDFNQSEIVR